MVLMGTEKQIMGHRSTWSKKHKVSPKNGLLMSEKIKELGKGGA